MTMIPFKKPVTVPTAVRRGSSRITSGVPVIRDATPTCAAICAAPPAQLIPAQESDLHLRASIMISRLTVPPAKE